MELQAETIATIALGVVSGFYALGLRALSAENTALKTELETFRKQHERDIERLDESHGEIWGEIKCQRESLAENREAIIKLNASIDRLNELLPRLESALGSKVSQEQCEFNRAGYSRRHTDAKHGG